jgi:hypothetical protein
VSPGDSSTFTATADLAAGGTENYTQKVVWDSSNPAWRSQRTPATTAVGSRR